MTLDATTITLLTGFLVPLIVATVTKAKASSVFKAFVTGILSAGVVGLNAIVGPAGTAVLSQESLTIAAKAFVVAFTSYESFWKHLDINAKLFPYNGFGLPKK